MSEKYNCTDVIYQKSVYFEQWVVVILRMTLNTHYLMHIFMYSVLEIKLFNS